MTKIPKTGVGYPQKGPFKIRLLLGVLAGSALAILAFLLLSQLALLPVDSKPESFSSFAQSRIISTLLFTIYQAGLSTICAIIVGVVFAWSLAYQPRFPFRAFLITLISSALVLPTLVVVLGLVTVFGRSGWLAGISHTVSGHALPFTIYGLTGILIAHTFFNASFAARIFLTRFEAIPREKHKLAFSLGLGFAQRLKVVDFPAISPAIPGIAITIFLLCFTSFAIVLTLGGSPAYNTLEVAIYEAVKLDFNLTAAYRLALTQIVICLALVVLGARNTMAMVQPGNVPSSMEYHRLISNSQKLIQIGAIAVFSLFFITPLLAILVDGAGPQLIAIFGNSSFQHALSNSLIIAFLSTIITLIVSISIAGAMVSKATEIGSASNSLSSVTIYFLQASAMVYLVFPALVMGLSFFLLSQKIGGDQKLWARSILIIANATIAIPFAIAGLRPSMASAAQKYDRISNTLGLGREIKWRLIEWPLIKRDITYVAAIAFCFSLGDLGVISLFGSNDFQTLPWLLYNNFGSYRTQDASAIALVLLGIIIAVFVVAQFTSGKEQPHAPD